MSVHHAEEKSDGALAAGFAAHERWAFGEAYRRYAGLLYSTAYNVLYNTDEAEDCIADTLTKLWRTPGAYATARGNLRSFLVVCIRNDAISRRRRESRRVRLTERLAAMPVEHAELRLPDPIERDRVRKAMLALPIEQRTALALAYYEGKTQSEIATELAEPLGTIKSRIKLGLKKLGSLLDSGGGFEGDR
jgi:RNA polymerase sigma-70 factor (ECF subfamily)